MFEKLKSFDESTIQLRLLFGSVRYVQMSIGQVTVSRNRWANVLWAIDTDPDIETVQYIYTVDVCITAITHNPLGAIKNAA